jgi:hypothetical protein
MNTHHRCTLMHILLFAVFLLMGASFDVEASDEKQWRFRVYLDDREIGHHTVRLITEADKKQVSVEAKFDVKFLFITAYRYEHKAEELWEGSCLDRILSSTDDNGEQMFVRSEPGANGITLTTQTGTRKLEGCVRSFAYWDLELLKTQRLLNTQTGEYQDVEIVALGNRPLEIDGERINARQYRLSVEDYHIDLWYTPDMNWLALQSITESGYRLRYLPDRRMF